MLLQEGLYTDTGLMGNKRRAAAGVSLNENTEHCDPRKASLHLQSPRHESREIESQWGAFDWRLCHVDPSTYRKTDVECNRLSPAEI